MIISVYYRLFCDNEIRNPETSKGVKNEKKNSLGDFDVLFALSRKCIDQLVHHIDII